MRNFNNSKSSQTNPSSFTSKKVESTGKRNWTAIEVLELVKNDKLRLSDNAGTLNLAYQLAMTPDEYLNDLFTHTVNEEVAKMVMCDDSFRENYPVAGSVQVTPDAIICGLMPTGDPVILNPDRLFCNMGVFGRPGSGKTSWLYLLIMQLLIKGPINDNR